MSFGSAMRCFRRHRGWPLPEVFSHGPDAPLPGGRLVPARHSASEDRSRFHFRDVQCYPRNMRCFVFELH
jgi:hypothetical protein